MLCFPDRRPDGVTGQAWADPLAREPLDGLSLANTLSGVTCHGLVASTLVCEIAGEELELPEV